MVNQSPLSPLIFYLMVEIIAFVSLGIRAMMGKPIVRNRFCILPLAATAATQAISGLIETGLGVAQKIKAAKLAKRLVRPKLESNPYTDQAYGLTGSQAQEGLSEGAKDLYTTTNDRNLSAAFDSIIKGGGNANNIADAFANSQDILRAMALTDDQARLQKTSNFLNYGLLPKANEERDKWFINKYAPYKDQAEAIANLSQQGMSDIWKGINSAGQAATGFLASKQPNVDTSSALDGGNFGRYSMPVMSAPTPTPTVQVGPPPPSSPSVDESTSLLNANSLLKKYFNRGI